MPYLLPADLDDETIRLAHDMKVDGIIDASAPRLLMIERLRRLEDFARVHGATRQVFQKLYYVRILLGDKEVLGKIDIPFIFDN